MNWLDEYQKLGKTADMARVKYDELNKFREVAERDLASLRSDTTDAQKALTAILNEIKTYAEHTRRG